MPQTPLHAKRPPPQLQPKALSRVLQPPHQILMTGWTACDTSCIFKQSHPMNPLTDVPSCMWMCHSVEMYQQGDEMAVKWFSRGLGDVPRDALFSMDCAQLGNFVGFTASKWLFSLADLFSSNNVRRHLCRLISQYCDNQSLRPV